jgi:hypothetical protein
MALDPIDRASGIAETTIVTSLAHGTLANVSRTDSRDQEPGGSEHRLDARLTTAEGPAVRDAQSISDRIVADEAAADAARDLFTANGLPAIEPVSGFARLAGSGELLHSVRYNAILERAPTDEIAPELRGGTLYLTSRRLLHTGETTTDVALGEIDEMVVVLERLVLIRLRDGSDLAVEVDQPRLLRVQIAAAMGAVRGTAG